MKAVLPSFFIPELTATAPGIARAVSWLFLFDALLIVAAFVGGITLMRFRARLSAEQAPRVAAATPFRHFYRQFVSARRMLVQSCVIVAIGFSLALVTVGLSGPLIEFFTVVVLAGVYLPLYFVLGFFERLFGLTADRIDELLKQTGERGGANPPA